MKLIEQYLEVVGRRLPANSRREIKEELRSLLLDELEARYGTVPSEANAGQVSTSGSEPTPEQVKAVLAEFGSPGTVADRYRGEPRNVIAPGLTGFYFFLLRIVLGSVALAFTVLMVLGLVQGNAPSAEVLSMVDRTLNAWMGAFAFITLGFILVTRTGWVTEVDLDEDWTPDELDEVEVGPEPVSLWESVISVVMLLVMISLMNFFPEILTTAENLFLQSGLGLGHRINIPLFRIYMHAISVAWIGELVYHGLLLYGIPRGKALIRLKFGAELASTVVLAALVADARVYLDYTGLVGFRLVFAIILVIQIWEIVSMLVKWWKGFREAPR